VVVRPVFVDFKQRLRDSRRLGDIASAGFARIVGACIFRCDFGYVAATLARTLTAIADCLDLSRRKFGRLQPRSCEKQKTNEKGQIWTGSFHFTIFYYFPPVFVTVIGGQSSRFLMKAVVGLMAVSAPVTGCLKAACIRPQLSKILRIQFGFEPQRTVKL